MLMIDPITINSWLKFIELGYAVFNITLEWKTHTYLRLCNKICLYLPKEYIYLCPESYGQSV